MTSLEFNNLSLSHQSSFLWEQGVLLSSRSGYFESVDLYSLHNFFVEVYFSPEKSLLDRITIPDTEGVVLYLEDQPLPGDLFS
jgi:hypothetical protein